MGDWEEEANEIVAKKVTSCWDDDLEDAVPDSWDAVEPTQPEPKPAPEKIPLAERIRLKEEKRRKEKEEKLRQQEEERLAQPTTELEREKIAEEAELALMRDTFGSAPTVAEPKTDGIDNFDPRTKEDFNRLNELLREKLQKAEKSPHYSAFVEQLIRDAIIEVDVETLKSISTAVLALMTEKQKINKSKAKKKGKGKLVVEREGDYDFDGDAAVEPDEYDDFM